MALLESPAAMCQWQYSTLLNAILSIWNSWIHGLHVVRNIFKTFYLQIELLIHHGPICQTQCRLGLDCHIKYNTPHHSITHATKRARFLKYLHGWKPSAYQRLLCISSPTPAISQHSPSHSAVLHWPMQTDTTHRVSCQFERGERITSKTFRRY